MVSRPRLSVRIVPTKVARSHAHGRRDQGQKIKARGRARLCRCILVNVQQPVGPVSSLDITPVSRLRRLTAALTLRVSRARPVLITSFNKTHHVQCLSPTPRRALSAPSARPSRAPESAPPTLKPPPSPLPPRVFARDSERPLVIAHPPGRWRCSARAICTTETAVSTHRPRPPLLPVRTRGSSSLSWTGRRVCGRRRRRRTLGG